MLPKVQLLWFLESHNECKACTTDVFGVLIIGQLLVLLSPYLPHVTEFQGVVAKIVID